MPGDFSSAAPFIVAATLVPELADRGSHDVNLNPTPYRSARTSSNAWAHAIAHPTSAISMRAREQVGDARGANSAEVTATDDQEQARCRVLDRRAAALRARSRRWLSRRELASTAPASCARRRPDRIEAVTRRRSPRDRRIADQGAAKTASPSRASRSRPKRGGRMESRGDHRIAMLGAVAGLWSRVKGVRDRRTPRAVADILPRFLRPLGVSGPALTYVHESSFSRAFAGGESA